MYHLAHVPLIGVLIAVGFLYSHAQQQGYHDGNHHDTPCSLDVTLLTSTVEEGNPGFLTGMLFLIDDYVLDTEIDTIGNNTAAPHHSYYEFLRPATPKELKKDKIKTGESGIIFPDGNIYHVIKSPNFNGFFQAEDSFQGTYDKLPDGNIPPGLIPLNPYDLLGISLKLESWKEKHAVFNCLLGTIVVYSESCPLDRFFVPKEAADRYEAKKRASRTLLGKSLLVTYPDSLVTFSRVVIEKGALITEKQTAFLVTVQDIYVGKNCCILDIGKKNKYLYWDSSSKITVKDWECHQQEVKSAQEALILAQKAEAEKERHQKLQADLYTKTENLILGKTSPSSGELGPDFWATLASQFSLTTNSKGVKKWSPQHQSSHTYNLEVNISETGNMHLVSVYSGEEWLFHTQVIVTIGDKTYYSTSVKPYTAGSHYDRLGAQITERNDLPNYGDDEILKQIALNPNAEISVTFVGKKKPKIVLTADQKKQIRNGYLWGLYVSDN